jgi:hypothetical protein
MRDDLLAKQRVLDDYIALMEELKGRHTIVRDILNDAIEGKFVLPPTILGELCYLQLRMICELIALGCLLVHGDIKETRSGKLPKKWHAGEIIERLAALHPPFYPRPTDQLLDETGAVIGTVPITKEYLTKEKLLKLYAECGAALHRGTLKDILSPDPRLLDMGKVTDWMADIAHLLNHHQIPLVDQRSEIWALMNESEDGSVRAYLMPVLTP